MLEIQTDGSFIDRGSRSGSWAFLAFKDGVRVYEEVGGGEESVVPSSRAAEALAIDAAIGWLGVQGLQAERIVIKTDCYNLAELIQGLRSTESKTLAPIVERIRTRMSAFPQLELVLVDRSEVARAHQLARGISVGLRAELRREERWPKRIEAPEDVVAVQVFGSFVGYPLHAGAWSYVSTLGGEIFSSRVDLAGPGFVHGSSEVLAMEAVRSALEDLVQLNETQRPVWIKITSPMLVNQIVSRTSFRKGVKGDLPRQVGERIHELGDEFAQLRIVRVDEPCVRQASKLARARMTPFINSARAELRVKSTRGHFRATGA